MKFIYPILFLSLLLPVVGSAQDGSSRPSEQEEKRQIVQINGLGRANINNTSIDGNVLEGDTSTARKLTDGEFLLDLAVNAQPTEQVEVQGILRIRNEFGGFFGAGVTVEVRELWARGVIANAVKWRVGDFDHVMTPYTFFNYQEEGVVNEPEAFRPFKELIYYEQFYTDEFTRRLQGANLDFGLDFASILQEANFNGFIARIRGNDFFTTPTRFTGGGTAQFVTQTLADSLGLKAKVGVNVSHVWDDLNSVQANTGIRNLVWSINYDVSIIDRKKIGLNLVGETGKSLLRTRVGDETGEVDKDDSFLDIGLSFTHKPTNLKVSASFIDIGPDFFSVAAQSKRVDLNREKAYFDRVTNDRLQRMPSLFDLGHDRALYTFQLSDQLMPYDPRFSNVLPYGQATPNRRGTKIGLEYGDDNNVIDAGLTAAILTEIRGQGTNELKDFTQLRATADFNIHNLVGWEKTLRLTAGWQFENTTRGGVEVEQIDFQSNMIELGLEAELFTRFDVLLGTKLLNANGNEYIPLISEFNTVDDFPGRYEVDGSETWLAAGLRYRFKEGIFLSLQYERFGLTDDLLTANDYNIEQFFVLYSMQF